MKNALLVLCTILLGCLTLGCNSKDSVEHERDPAAQFKPSGIQTALTERPPVSPPAPPAQPAHAPDAVLPLAITGTEARLVRFELASAIVEREPTGVATHFSRASTPRVFAFVEVANKHGEPFEIDVRFEPVEATAKGRGFKLAIPDAERWRTQALMATRKSGSYRAVVSAPDGTELIVREFTVSE